MVKAGEIAYIKTSGESCFVKEIVDTAVPLKCDGNPSGLTAKVRTPKLNRDLGILHSDEYYFFEELETYAEKLGREHSDVKAARKLMNESGTAISASLFDEPDTDLPQ